MPTITTDDGVSLQYEESGTGTPLVFVHEFAGDARAWEPQMRFFARRAATAHRARDRGGGEHEAEERGVEAHRSAHFHPLPA